MAKSDRTSMQLKDRPEFAQKQRPLTMAASSSVAEAVNAMCAKNYGSVVIVDGDDKVEGILTERDIMRKIVNENRLPDQTKVSEVMTHDVRVATETDDVVDWLRIMSNERFRRLPVVDEKGRIKAVFTQGDFVSYTWPDLLYQAGQLARASVFKNWHLLLIGGGIMLYTLLMIVALQVY